MSTRRTAGVLDEARGVRAMTWVIAIMLFLTVLAAALGLATRSAARSLDRQLAGRLTVQVTGDAARVLAALAANPAIRRAAAVPRAELARLLAPWLGEDGGDPDLPIPTLIDVDLADAAPATALAAARAVRAVAPDARIDRHAAWMSPVASMLRGATWFAALLVALMATVTATIVMLAARAGLDAHRPTIEVMHMLGATDAQVARLFQRRIARDAALGGIVGTVAAVAAVLFLGGQVATLGSELLGQATIGAGGWALIALLPLGFVLLAIVAARVAVVHSLRRVL